MSQSKEEDPRGTETRLRDREETISETEGQDCWREEKVGKAERDGGGLGRLGETREEAVEAESGSGEGLERASTTTLSTPGMCTTELVNSAK